MSDEEGINPPAYEPTLNDNPEPKQEDPNAPINIKVRVPFFSFSKAIRFFLHYLYFVSSRRFRFDFLSSIWLDRTGARFLRRRSLL
jgi:hypothetical protein